VTLLDAPEAPFRLLSNSLSFDSVARLVNAATVEATFAVWLAAELEGLLAPAVVAVAAATVFCAEAALDALKRLDRAEAWLLLMLSIDIMLPIAAAGSIAIGRDSKNLSRTVLQDCVLEPKGEIPAITVAFGDGKRISRLES
jgi:hypothetical protein